MNFIQFGLFFIYVLSSALLGLSLYTYLGQSNQDTSKSRLVILGEACLIGSSVLYGAFMLLAMLGLYTATFLWGAVGLGLLVILKSSVRCDIVQLFKQPMRWDIPLFGFVALLLVFVFRNLYFLIDVDSHSTYLFTQKLWLTHGTSLIGDIGTDIRAFVSQFDGMPYGLGLSIFPNELLFPALITIFWRVLVLMLAFGYTSYRFNRYYALAATMFIAFNAHFFYSGINAWVIINGAVIAFLFASVVNFWEARRHNNSFYFFLGILFLSQLMSNKYQMFYALIFIPTLGFVVHHNRFAMVGKVLSEKRWVMTIIVAFLIGGLVFIKNWIVTGLPTYPILADKFQIFNWTADMGMVYKKVQGGVSLPKFFKYFTYFFIWPGINVAKIVSIIITLFPFVLIVLCLKEKLEKESLLEWGIDWRFVYYF